LDLPGGGTTISGLTWATVGEMTSEGGWGGVGGGGGGGEGPISRREWIHNLCRRSYASWKKKLLL